MTDEDQQTIRITVPINSPSPGREGQRWHIEVQLDSAQSAALRRVRDALDGTHVRLSNGRRVWSRADTVRWLAERIGAAAG